MRQVRDHGKITIYNYTMTITQGRVVLILKTVLREHVAIISILGDGKYMLARLHAAHCVRDGHAQSVDVHSGDGGFLSNMIHLHPFSMLLYFHVQNERKTE